MGLFVCVFYAAVLLILSVYGIHRSYLVIMEARLRGRLQVLKAGVPPVRGEEPMRPNGQPMGTYKYWSRAAQATMVEHVKGLLKLYGKGMRRTPDGKIIMQTMFEPIPKPSFDAEGPCAGHLGFSRGKTHAPSRHSPPLSMEANARACARRP